MLAPNPVPNGLAPKVDDVPNPDVVVVEVPLPLNPANVLGVAAVLLIDPGLVDVGPPKNELVPVPVVVVPFGVVVAKLKGGGFFFVAPDNPNTAG